MEIISTCNLISGENVAILHQIKLLASTSSYLDFRINLIREKGCTLGTLLSNTLLICQFIIGIMQGYYDAACLFICTKKVKSAKGDIYRKKLWNVKLSALKRLQLSHLLKMGVKQLGSLDVIRVRRHIPMIFKKNYTQGEWARKISGLGSIGKQSVKNGGHRTVDAGD